MREAGGGQKAACGRSATLTGDKAIHAKYITPRPLPSAHSHPHSLVWASAVGLLLDCHGVHVACGAQHIKLLRPATRCSCWRPLLRADQEHAVAAVCIWVLFACLDMCVWRGRWLVCVVSCM